MAILSLRRKRKPVKSDAQARIAALEAALETCTAAVQRLQQADETHIKRMAAMQAEIDHLRAQRGN